MSDEAAPKKQPKQPRKKRSYRAEMAELNSRVDMAFLILRRMLPDLEGSNAVLCNVVIETLEGK
jgi:hypothetical protein